MSAIGDKLKGTGSSIGNKLNSGNSNYEQTKRVLNKMAQDEVAKSQEQPKYSFNPEVASAAKQMVNSRIARTTATSLPKIVEQKKSEREEQERWDSLSLGEKIADPFKTAEANRKHGELGIEESKAWNDYRSKQNQETLAKAQAATKAREEFELSNDRIGKGNAFTKDFAGYVPQLFGQLGAGLSGAAAGAGAGALGGAGVALAAGQLGPQVLVPEEIATVPAGAVTGAIWGGRGGYVAGNAKYSYDLMAGNAYKTLLDMGVPNEVALELSGDEALISSLIEGAGSVVDLISLGIGKLATKGGTTAAKKVALNRLTAAAKAYGLNLISEPLEEGAQQIVSIETQKKAAEKSGIERNVTEAQDKQSILDSMQAGFNIAAISGLGNVAGNVATNAVSNKIAENRQLNQDIADMRSLYKTQQAMETYKNLSPYSKYQLQETDTKISSKDVKVPQRTMLPEGGKIYVDPQGVAVDSRNYVAPRQEANQTEEINKKSQLINKISNNTYLANEDKINLINQVNKTEYTEELENSIDSLLQTVNDELGLKNISNNFKENKTKYGEYLRDETDYDKTQIENAKNAIPSNKSGRRTKEQWLDVAKNLGSQIYEMSDADVEKLAYKTWMDNKPNNKDNLNRQGQKYVKFGLDEWVNTVYDEVKKYRVANLTQKTNNILPTQSQNVRYSPVNARQVLQGEALPRATQVKQTTDTELKLPTTKTNSVYQAAKNNKVDVKLANRLMDIAERTNVRVEGFYDENPNIEGSYKDGVIRINVNSEKAADTIFAHEFTHHLESTNAWKYVRDAIINSNTLYNMLSEKGINIDEYKQQIKDAYAKIKTKENPNGIILDDVGVEKEIVAKFVESKLMKDEKTIVRMINENPSFMQRLKNFWDDLVVRFKGTAEEKELRRIQNIYNKAFAEAQKGTTTSTETEYSIGGIKGARRIQKNANYSDILSNYDKATQMIADNKNIDNETLIRETGWYKDTEGNLKYEFTDEDMDIKDNFKFDTTKMYSLEQILKHDIIFEAYPELKDYTVISGNLGNKDGAIFAPGKIILLNKNKLNTKSDVAATLMHEVQHAIQVVEGFPGARTTWGGKSAYFESLGEIEAADTKRRIEMTMEERARILPETAKPNPIHPAIRERNQAKQQAVRQSVNEALNGTVGKDMQYSINTDNQGRKLSQQQQEFFKDSKVRDENGNLKVMYHSTNSEFNTFDISKSNEGIYGKGFYFTEDESFSKNYGNRLVKAYLNVKNPLYANYSTEQKTFNDTNIKEFLEEVYRKEKIDLNKYGKWATVDNFANRLNGDSDWYIISQIKQTFGIKPTNLIKISNDLGITSYDGIIAKNEIIVFEPNQIKNVDNTNPTSDPDIRYSINTDNMGRKLSEQQQEFFKDSKVRDENGKLLEVYHGTENKFNIYKSEYNEFFFTDSEIASRDYGSVSKKQYLNLINPYEVDYAGGYDKRILDDIDYAKANGYDGVIARNTYDGANTHTQYVAFEPNQIKNVDNTKPTSNPDIRYSIETDKQTSTPKREKVVDKIAPQTDIEIDNLPDETEKVARVLTKAPKKQQDFSFETVKDVLMRKIVDAGNTINTIGKIAKDDVLYPMYNNTKQARQSAEYMIGEKQTDITGTRIVGNSLIEVFEPIKRKGEEYTGKFYEYLLHMHNIDRMAQDKPVFGKSVTAEDSKRIADQLLKENPEFERLANRVYVYNRNLMQWRVDSGLVSQEQADEMNRIYPHYVPTFRDMSGIAGAKVIGNSVNISQTLKKATGSDRDILPIDLSMARQTMQTVQAAKRNLLGNRLLNDALANKDQVGKYITTIEKSDDSLDIDEQSDAALSSEKNNNIFKIYRDGKSVNMYVNNGIFEGLKAISSQTDNTDTSKLLSALSKPNTIFKQLVTGFNPMFMLKNPIRDVQDAALYSKNLREFAKEYPQTFKEMVNNSKDWQLYKSLGGTGSTFFDYETGIENELNKGKLTRTKEATLGRIEYLNMLTEQAPRFAEFKATLEKAGNRDYDTLLKAVYNAADVTVNFGRSGSITQILNKTAVPFLNPSIQGASKTIRTIVTTKGGTEWAKLVTKLALFGILPSVLNELLYWDDEDYEKLNDRDKDVNFVLKYGDNQWIKIPKGRVISFLGNLANRGIRVARGQEVNWGDFLATTLDQTAPISPFESNIVSPIKAVKDNKTWYGSDIVPQRLQQYEPRDQYDEKTDAFSKWLGGILNYSPKKINYLIDAYTGVIGDFALPLTTPTAETNPFAKAFTIDGTFSNEIGNKFYETKDKYNKYKNDTPTATVVTRYLNKQNEMASDLYAEIRKVQSSDISDKEKKAKASELRELINLIQANAVLYAEEYEQVVNKYINKFPKNPDRSADYAYLMANYELFGPEYAVKTYNLSTYNKNKHKNMQTVFNQIKNNFNTTKPVSAQKTETLPTAKDIPTKK